MENNNGGIPLHERILINNGGCAVVNKLAGEAAQHAFGAKGKIINLPKELKKLLNTDIAQAVHRIDVPVTGCVLFAFNAFSLKFLNGVFTCKNDSVKKTYWAVVEKPSFDAPQSGCLTHWIEINPRVNKSFAYNEEGPQRKKAVLNYRIIGSGDNYIFLEIELVTGRHHQIRSQLAAINLHIKGDVKYGARRSEKNGGIRLHARSLSFPKPQEKTNENEIIIVNAMPPFMDSLWSAFPC